RHRRAPARRRRRGTSSRPAGPPAPARAGGDACSHPIAPETRGDRNRDPGARAPVVDLVLHPTPATSRPSPFHPAVAEWFTSRFGQATPPQQEGWPAIGEGRHTLIAAPTGSGKTLAAFLWAIDGLFRQGEALPDATQVLYVSPLRALSN